MTEGIENGTAIDTSDAAEAVGGLTVSVTAVTDGIEQDEVGGQASDAENEEYEADEGAESSDTLADGAQNADAETSADFSAETSADVSSDLSADLYELVKLFPRVRRFSDISAIPGAKRYAELRAAGLSSEEAYLAVNGRDELALRGESERIQRGQRELSHVTAAVHGGSTPHRLMTEAQRRAARATIGTDISDAELDMLWKKVYGENA